MHEETDTAHNEQAACGVRIHAVALDEGQSKVKRMRHITGPPVGLVRVQMWVRITEVHIALPY